MRYVLLGLGLLACLEASAETLTRELALDIKSLVKSRDLSGFAIREDGRLVAGPALAPIPGELQGIPWSMAPFPGSADGASRWLVGTGPEAKVHLLRLSESGFESSPWASLSGTHVQAVAAVDGATALAGTLPRATLFLIREGNIISRLPLGTEALWCILPDGPGFFLVGTGNPARVLRVDISRFSSLGIRETPIDGPEALAAAGIVQLAEIRDSHVRTLLRRKDGSLMIGSAPRGAVYHLTAEGSTPRLTNDGPKGEVTGFIETTSGRILATITHGERSQDSSRNSNGNPMLDAIRMSMQQLSGEDSDMMMQQAGGPFIPPASSMGGGTSQESFAGEGTLVDVTPDAFPETLLRRAGMAFNSLTEHEGLIFIAGGEAGEVVAWNGQTRKSAILSGTPSSQNIRFEPAGDGTLLLLGANPAGLARLQPAPDGERSLTTASIDLAVPTRLGRLVLERIRPAGTPAPAVAFQVSLGSDEPERWSEWQNASERGGGSYDLGGMAARRLRLRLNWPAGLAPGAEITRLLVYHLPRNEPPKVESFRILPQNIGLLRNPEPPAQPFIPLMQLLQPGMSMMQEGQSANTTPGGGVPGGNNAAERNQGFMSSPLVQAVGTQIVVWNVSDPNGDVLRHTLRMRAEGASEWTDILVDSPEVFAQFDVSSLPDGPYTVRLESREVTQHPDGAITSVHEDDTLMVDNSLPEILSAAVTREAGNLILTVHGRDATSRLGHALFIFNNGLQAESHNPVDGVLDSREEIFRLSLPEAPYSNATAVEAIVFDSVGNGQVRRLSLVSP